MRTLLVLALLLGAGCVSVDDGETIPYVSVNYASSYQNGVERVSASLNDVSAEIKGWHHLDVAGCNAPTEGAIDLPHHFTGCSGRLTISYAPTGRILYDSD